MALPTKTKTVKIAHATFKFECEPCEGEYLDTTVSINGVYFCSISWPDLQSFIDDLELTIAKHSI
jgi:hypothetical protein